MQRTESFITTDDGVRLHLVIKGNGARVVIVPLAIYLEDVFDEVIAGYTFVFFDPRNRGRSNSVTNRKQVERGVHHDVEDLEAIRRFLNVDQVDVIGWSYFGLTVALYAMNYATHVRRLVQLGPMQPNPTTQYPAHLTNDDATRREVLAYMGQMQSKPPPNDPVEACKQAWNVLRKLYVANISDIGKIANWGFCELENERNQFKHLMGNIMPSIMTLNLQSTDFAKASMPVLIIHGDKDRSAPFGGGLEWARCLPDARFVGIEGAAHVPWVEAPELVLGSIKTFLDGAWPGAAKKIE